MFEFRFLQSLIGLQGPLYFGGGSHAGPTAQQQALQTEQATTNANLNLEENEQRKVILNAMQGTRVFRGSALSRAIASNSAGTAAPTPPPGISGQQQNGVQRTPGAGNSLLDIPGASPTPGLTTFGQPLAGGPVAAPSSAGRGSGAGTGRA